MRSGCLFASEKNGLHRCVLMPSPDTTGEALIGQLVCRENASQARGL